jgi:hypothetical protein
MISSSPGQRVEFFLVFREAGRSAPMMAADRSKLSRRAIFLLLVSLGLPRPGRAANLEDSAKELARRVAASISVPEATGQQARNEISIKFQNSSALAPREFDALCESLIAELQVSGIIVGDGNSALPRAVITLSEGMENYVWTAEIQQEKTSQVFITAASMPHENHVVTNEMRVTLHSEKIWEGPDRILDVTYVFLPNLEQRMVLLFGDGIIITDPQNGANFKTVGFPHSRNSDRDPSGELSQVGNLVRSALGGRECDVALGTETLVGCYVLKGPIDLNRMELLDLDQPSYGDQVKDLLPNCGMNNLVLAAGTGDYTQPDSIQAFHDKKPVSNSLNVPGPVLKFSLGPDTQFVSAIVHNVKDDKYELYRLSISCGQ